MRKIIKAVEKNKSESGYYFSGATPQRGNKTIIRQENIIEIAPEEVRENRVLVGKQMEAGVMAYNILRTHVYKSMTSDGVVNLGITSCQPGEGKSLTSINLALSMARSVQQKVILIDYDLRKNSIKDKLNLSPKKGISDYYQGDAGLADIVYEDSVSGLLVIPGRECLDNAGDLIASKKTPLLLNELKRAFPSRIVLMDLPPILVVDDVASLMDYMGKLLFVVSEGRTHKEDLERALELVGEEKLMGTVLNNSKESKREVGGYYTYYYGG